jgi:hypothetical protein
MKALGKREVGQDMGICTTGWSYKWVFLRSVTMPRDERSLLDKCSVFDGEYLGIWKLTWKAK